MAALQLQSLLCACICWVPPKADGPIRVPSAHTPAVQARASYYHAIAQRVASWGYVVAQYDTPLLRIFNVSSEVRFLWARRGGLAR